VKQEISVAKSFVTGATGFIGSNLVRWLLARGDEVSCLVRESSSPENLDSLDVRLVAGDLFSSDELRRAVRGQDFVYHVAGCTRALRREELFRVNELGTANVAEACASADSPPVLTMVSSLAAAGVAPRGRLRHEADPPVPVSWYGRSKLAAEHAIRRRAGAVPITVVRPPMVLGPADHMGLEMYLSLQRFGVHLSPGYRRLRYSVIDAADLAELMYRAAHRGERLPPTDAEDPGPGTGIYYAATDDHPTYGELGRLIADALGRRWRVVIPVAMPVVWGTAACGELTGQLRGRPVYLCIDKAREITAGSWACSAEKARRQLGFEPACPLSERLEQTVAWYRREGWL
jgi:nucleoside-diphosphate-sugar epimerase